MPIEESITGVISVIESRSYRRFEIPEFQKVERQAIAVIENVFTEMISNPTDRRRVAAWVAEKFGS